MMLRTTRIVKRPSEKLCYQRRFSIVPKSFSAGTFKRSRRLFSGAKLATSELDGVDSSDDFGEYEIILPPDPPVWGVSHLTPRTVPADILRPPYARPGSGTTPISSSAAVSEDPYHGDPYEGDGRIELGGESEKKLRLSASLARRVLEVAEKLVKAGVTTDSIDAALHAFIVSNLAYPSPLHYAGFPRSCCTSVNNVVVHGIPDNRALKDGDIVNVDVTVYLDGFHGDTSRTFLVGEVDHLGRTLVEATNEALDAGIRACGPGKEFKTIGEAIYRVAMARNLSVSSQFSGHGIGTVFHRPPWILHHRNDEPGIMQPGHCFTIEPCLIQGSDPRAWIFPDGWTASTMNGARSAQAEHMILVTETGINVLTE